MALKYISELTLTNNIDDNDLLVVDDGSKNYAIKWSTLKAALATVSGFTVNNTNGTITITLATGASLTVTPHDPTKQDLLTFDSTPTENSNNPVKSGGVFAAIGLKLDAADYAQYTGATDQQAGTAGYVPAPVAGGERYLSSSGVWQAPDSTPTENSNKPVSSDAVYAALLDLAEQLSDEYDATATYDVGDYCIHENKLYKCTTAIATAEAWNSAHWTATTVGAELGAKVNTSDIVNNLTNAVTGTAGFHNSIYRGKNLGTSVTAAQYAAISAGTFDDMFIGDYWVINSVTWRIAGFDYWLHCGDTECTTHHVVIVPDTNLASAKMNNTNITTGGYVGSDMYTGANSNTGLSTAKSTINSAFGSAHILNHRQLLSNAVAGGKASAWSWYDSTVDLMNESMVYGSPVSGAQKTGDTNFNVGIDHSQLPLFRLDNSRVCNRAAWWLRDVASATYFAYVRYSGDAGYGNASYSNGVRPAFGIKA